MLEFARAQCGLGLTSSHTDQWVGAPFPEGNSRMFFPGPGIITTKFLGEERTLMPHLFHVLVVLLEHVDEGAARGL